MEEIFRHPWILGENEEPIPRHNTLPHILATAPQASVINYMTKMFNFKESDILSSLGEKKVNAIAATYFLLQKRFEQGLHLVGLSMDLPSVRRDSSFSAFSIELARRDTKTAGKPSYGSIENLDSSRDYRGETRPATTYKNYLQYMKESRERTNAFSKNIFLRRQKTRAPLTKQNRSENNNESKNPFDNRPEFRLTFAPNHAEVYEWESEGMLRKQQTRMRPKLGEFIKERDRPKSPEKTTMIVTGEVKISHQTHLSPPPPLTPPNTSHGVRVVNTPDVKEDEEDIIINPLPTVTPAPPPPPSPSPSPVKAQYPPPQTAPVRFHLRGNIRPIPTPKVQAISNEEIDKSNKQEYAIVLADPCSQEIWGSFQKHKAKLIKGNSLTFSRSRTIYANPISSQKVLTPRDHRPALEDIHKAQVIGHGKCFLTNLQSMSMKQVLYSIM